MKSYTIIQSFWPIDTSADQVTMHAATTAINFTSIRTNKQGSRIEQRQEPFLLHVLSTSQFWLWLWNTSTFLCHSCRLFNNSKILENICDINSKTKKLLLTFRHYLEIWNPTYYIKYGNNCINCSLQGLSRLALKLAKHDSLPVNEKIPSHVGTRTFQLQQQYIAYRLHNLHLHAI